MKKLMIYGATGYTGRLATTYANEAGLDLVIASRDGAALADLAGTLLVEGRAFSLDDSKTVADALRGVDVLLNCAGPFHRTARPLIAACIAGGVHYLDIAAELDSYRLVEELDAQAKCAGVMLLPGSGGSVAMLGCVAHHALARVLEPHTIKLVLRVAGSMSRGSALSASENMAECLARISGRLVKQNPHATHAFDFGGCQASCRVNSRQAALLKAGMLVAGVEVSPIA